MLLTAIAPIAFGSAYVVTRQLLPADAPLWGGVLRMLPAGILLMLVARALPRGVWWWRALLLGILNMGGFSVLVYVAAQRLPSSVAATVMALSAGCMMLFGWALLHRRPRLAAVVGVAVGLVGVMLMTGFSAEVIDPWGIAASLGAMVASSLGFILTARWGADIPPLRLTAWQLVGGSLALLPVACMVEGPPPELTVLEGAGFVYLSLVATALGYTLWFAGLQQLSPTTVGLIGLLNPVTGVVLGVLVAGEFFGWAQALGVGLVLGGVVLGVVPLRRVRQRKGDV